jgi:uncharacterized membrane protein
MSGYWAALTSTPLLMAKLALVVILAALIGMISARSRRAIATNSDADLKKIEPLGKITLPIGIAIIILAVLVFH